MSSIPHLIEEETFSDYKPSQYYPVHIGETLKSSSSEYTVIGKLGYGRNSTVWLCNNPKSNMFYTVKVGTTHLKRVNKEERILKLLSNLQTAHAGRDFVRTLHEAFEMKGPDGSHHCLVHTPLGIDLLEFQDSFPDQRIPEVLVKGLLSCLLKALDFLHTEADVIHIDIQAKNVLFSLSDNATLKAFAQAERDSPSARKAIDETRSIYATRPLEFSLGDPILCDFGLAVMGKKHHGTIQPLPFRAPEVMLKMEWNSKVDIWNLGVLTWDLIFNKHLFNGKTEEEQLGRMIAILGPPPEEFLKNSNGNTDYFDESGGWKGQKYSATPLEDILEGGQAKLFMGFLKDMIAWDPKQRKNAKELMGHPWINTS